MTPHQSANVIAQIAAAWPHPTMTDLVAEAWHKTLAPLDLTPTMDAIRTLIATSAYRPTPADVAKLAGASPAGDRAFAQYLEAMRSPRCPALDPAVRKVMNDLGGWAYCHAQSADWHAKNFPHAWRRTYHLSDPLTEPMAELNPAPQDRHEVTGTPDERREFAAAQARAIRAGWRNGGAA